MLGLRAFWNVGAQGMLGVEPRALRGSGHTARGGPSEVRTDDGPTEAGTDGGQLPREMEKEHGRPL